MSWSHGIPPPLPPVLGVEPRWRKIRQNRGRLYDAAVVDACLKLFAEKRFSFSA
jgi:hypothetical protein